MFCYLLDTNILLRSILDPKHFSNEVEEAKLIKKRFAQLMLPQWFDNKATFIVPNFTIAEALRFFASISYNTSLLSQGRKKYHQIKREMIKLIKYQPTLSLSKPKNKKSVNMFFNYELNRHHLLNIDEILEYEHRVPKGSTKMMHAPDLLIISIAIELQRLVPQDKIYIVTRDKRIEKVCMAYQPKLPRAIYLADKKEKKRTFFQDSMRRVKLFLTGNKKGQVRLRLIICPI